MNLQKKDNPEIKNYPGYYSAGNMEHGIDGPELINDEYFMSVYHFLQLHGINPRDYDTFKYGNRMKSICSKNTYCKYESQSFIIYKYPYSELVEHQNEIENFRR